MPCILCWVKYVGYAFAGVGSGVVWLFQKAPSALPYLDTAYKFVFCNTCGVVPGVAG